MSGWQILVQQGPRAGQTFDLDKPVITIGREVGNDIILEDPQVSRHHARLTQQGAGFFIEDLGSTNGTMINGQRVTAAKPINPGDTIALGDTVVLQVMGTAGSSETIVAPGQPQTVAASYSPPVSPESFGAPPPPPLPPLAYGTPPPPPPPPQKQGSRVWLWGCGCLVLLCIIVFAIGVYLYSHPGPVNALLKMIGIDLQFQ